MGIFLRESIRRLNFRQILGINLAGIAFFAGIIIPETQNLISDVEVALETQKTVVVIDTAPSAFQWPLRQFGISQRFSYFHPGMDLTDPVGTPIQPIADGTVTWIKSTALGYGNHVLVTHNDGIQSLYAHMKRVFVKEGQSISKEEVIGEVGLTGWSTGSHLHFEVYEDSLPTNPIEILPAIKEL